MRVLWLMAVVVDQIQIHVNRVGCSDKGPRVLMQMFGALSVIVFFTCLLSLFIPI